MKKVWIAIACLAAIFVCAALILPFMSLVPYKPFLQSQFEKNLNGKLEFEEANLTLWTGFGIRFKNLQILNGPGDFEGQKFLQTEDAFLRFDLSDMFKGEMQGLLHVNRPTVTVLKKQNENSFRSLIKLSKPSTVPSSSQQPTTQSSSGTAETPKWVQTIAFNRVQINNGVAHYIDTDLQRAMLEVDSLEVSVDGDIKTQNVNFNIDFKIKSQNVDGPVYIKGNLQPQMSQANLLSFDVPNFHIDLSKAKVVFANWFQKNVNETLTLDGTASVTPQQWKAQKIKLNLQEQVLNADVTSDVSGSTQLNANAEILKLGSLSSFAVPNLFDLKNTSVSELVVEANVEKDVLAISQLNFNVWGGKIRSALNVERIAEEKFTAQFDTENIDTKPLMATFKLNDSPLNGRLTLNSEWSGLVKNHNEIKGSGSYTLHKPEISEKSLSAIFQKQLNEKVGGLQLAGLGNLTSIFGEDAQSQNASDISGKFVVQNQTVKIDSFQAHQSGRITVNSEIGFDKSLQGDGKYEFSKKFREKMLQTSKRAAWLFEKDGRFIVNFALAGNVEDPDVSIDFQSIAKRYEQNAGQKIEDEIKNEIEKYTGPEGKNNFDNLRQKLKDKLEKNKIRIPGL